MNRRNARVQKDGIDFEGWGGVRRISYSCTHPPPHFISRASKLLDTEKWSQRSSELSEWITWKSRYRLYPPYLSYSLKTLWFGSKIITTIQCHPHIISLKLKWINIVCPVHEVKWFYYCFFFSSHIFKIKTLGNFLLLGKILSKMSAHCDGEVVKDDSR